MAGVSFDEFHKHSAQIIQHAVFGTDSEGEPGQTLKFDANSLVKT